jgi:hypothetical protein
MKKSPAARVALIYIILMIGIHGASLLVEAGRECLAVDPYWMYGLIKLPCYFLDTLFKNLLNPTYSLMIWLPEIIPGMFLLWLTLMVNTFLVFLLLHFIYLVIFGQMELD